MNLKEKLVSIFLLVFILGCLGFVGTLEATEWVNDCEVVEVSGDLVVAETPSGNEFEFYGEDFEVGDLVKLTIDNRHTTTKSDDIVKNATIQE